MYKYCLLILGALVSAPLAAAPQFQLVEATVADIHAAFAGAQVLPDGKPLTCKKLADLYLNRIGAIDNWPQAGGPPVHAVLTLNPKVYDEAKALDKLYKTQGTGTRPLHCVPMLLKDNYETYDHPATSGSYSMLGHQPAIDAHSIAKLRAAGALILGKANQDEFALTTLAYSGRGVRTATPYNTQESAGGSSGGSAAALASNFAMLTTGTDTCGSIRYPSAVSAVVGLRPSVGLVSQHGVFPLISNRDSPGPMARTVHDLALALNAMAGADSRDPKTAAYTHPVYTTRPTDYTQFLNRTTNGLSGKKLALVRTYGGADALGAGTLNGPEVLGILDTAIAQMRAQGAEVFEIDLPDFVGANPQAVQYEWNQHFRKFEAENGFRAPRRCMSSARLMQSGSFECVGQEGIIETGLMAPVVNVLFGVIAATTDPNTPPAPAAIAQQAATRAYVESVMDAFVTPDNRTVRLDALLFRPQDGIGSAGSCEFGSTTQMPSMVVPMGYTADGVPKGVEILARKWDEPTLFGLAYDYEQATQHRRPPLLAGNPLAIFPGINTFNQASQQALAAVTSQDPWVIPAGDILRILNDQFGIQATIDDVMQALPPH